ncbi:MAG: hypothetical protein GY771_10870, partial [bacterium]|nr:hypothetical protein [bacterium]
MRIGKVFPLAFIGIVIICLLSCSEDEVGPGPIDDPVPGLTQFTTETANDFFAPWSPDGSMITY